MRNSILHDPTDVAALGNIQLNDRVSHYYDNSDDLLGAGDQHLVSKDIQELYSLSIPRNRNWLRHADIRAKCVLTQQDFLLSFAVRENVVHGRLRFRVDCEFLFLAPGMGHIYHKLNIA